MSRANVGPESKTAQMQDAYVEARINGATPPQAKAVSGYAETSRTRDIERKGGPVDQKLKLALAERGLTEEFLAREYATGIAASQKPGAREADYNAHAKYLLQLGYLLGHGKREIPPVAIQINQGEPGPTHSIAGQEFIGRLESLVAQLTAIAGSDELPDVSTGGPGDADTAAHPGVVEVAGDEPAPSGGGGA